MSKPHVWVVEMFWQGEWLACGSCNTHMHDFAVLDKVRWSKEHPDEQFRVAKYVRLEPTAKRRERK